MSISARDPRWKVASELQEMEGVLKKHGYDPKDAKALLAEGMGPEELEHRIKTTKPGEVGSLEYTHKLKKHKTARSKLTEVEIADGLFKAADALFTFRGRVLREQHDILQDAYDDATGLVTHNMYADPEVKKTRDAMHQLDQTIGEVARQMEWLARDLKKIPHRGGPSGV